VRCEVRGRGEERERGEERGARGVESAKVGE